MKAQIRHLSGSRAGQIEVHSQRELQLGRQSSCQVRFHPDEDLDVSGQHAVIRRTDKGWVVRDLNSSNGTFVNGHRINAETSLDDTDQIQLGSSGPKLEFRLVPENVPDTPPPVFQSARASAEGLRASSGNRPAVPQSATPRPSGTTQRIRMEVARQTRTLQRISIALAVVLVLAVGGFFLANRRQTETREQEIAAMRAQMDSIMRTADDAVRSLQGQMAGLADALRASQTQVQRLQAELTSAQASGDAGQIVQLRRQLDEASTTLRNQQVAARVDHNAIYKANQQAVGLVYVQFGTDSIFNGTAFAVRTDPNGSYLLTNKHVVAGRSGTQRPTRLGIQFADSKQFWRAEVVKLAPDADLALIRVNVPGGTKVVRGFGGAATGQPGEPVAVIGFPLGIELPMLSSGTDLPIAKTSLTVGTISKVLPDMVQVDGYGAEGSSGSPIFDVNGDVIAVLYGGQPGTGGRVVFAVPASYAQKLIQTLN